MCECVFKISLTVLLIVQPFSEKFAICQRRFKTIWKIVKWALPLWRNGQEKKINLLLISFDDSSTNKHRYLTYTEHFNSLFFEYKKLVNKHTEQTWKPQGN